MSKEGVLHFESKCTKARKGSLSVQTTVPQTICQVRGIKIGSKLVWGLDPKTGRVWIEKVNGK